jgi:hypothetical protein
MRNYFYVAFIVCTMYLSVSNFFYSNSYLCHFGYKCAVLGDDLFFGSAYFTEKVFCFAVFYFFRNQRFYFFAVKAVRRFMKIQGGEGFLLRKNVVSPRRQSSIATPLVQIYAHPVNLRLPPLRWRGMCPMINCK